MNNHSENPSTGSRPIAILLTIALQIGLAWYLYQQATAPDSQPEPVRMENAEVKAPSVP